MSDALNAIRLLAGDSVANTFFKSGPAAGRATAATPFAANTPVKSVVTTAVDLTLTAAHNGKVINVTAAKTVTVPAVTVLGSGFRCTIVANGGAVTIDGPGATNVSMTDGDIAELYALVTSIKVGKVAGTIIT